MTLHPKPVDCQCPPGFIFGVLDTLPGDLEMAACTRCGRTDLAEPISSEDRPHDVQFHGYSLFDLSPEARAWASGWPLYVRINRKKVYLSAAARFASVVERDAATAQALGQQTGVPLRGILISLGIPPGGPPPSLPPALACFVEIWNGLQLNDETPLDELLDAATRFNGPNQLAAEVLARRNDLPQTAALLLWDSNERSREQGRYLVEEFHLTGQDIVLPLRCRLGELSDNQTGEMTGICALFHKMGNAAVAALPDLEAAAVRVRENDYYAHQDVMTLIDRWKAGEAGLPTEV